MKYTYFFYTNYITIIFNKIDFFLIKYTIIMNYFELRLQCACRPGSKLLTLSFDILERIDKQFKIGKKNNSIKQRWQLLYYQEQQYIDMPELIF